MRFVSKAALAAALTLGLSGTVILPAQAMMKDKHEAKGDGLELSKDFRNQAAAVQGILTPTPEQLQADPTLKDNATVVAKAEPMVAQLLQVAKSNDETRYAHTFQLLLAQRKQDYATMKTAIEALVQNPTVNDQQKAAYYFTLGEIEHRNRNDDAAIVALQKAQAGGYVDKDGKLPQLMMRIYTDKGQPRQALGELDKSIAAQKAAGNTIPEQWYQLGVQTAYNAKDGPESINWLKRWIAAYPSTTSWNKGIRIFRESVPGGEASLNSSEKIDLFRLMRVTNSLNSQVDYEDYAQLSHEAGLPYETQAAIEAGQASGKIPTSSAAANQLLRQAKTAIRGDSLSGLESKAMASSSGKLAADTADAYLAKGDDASAVKLYQAALQKGGVDTDAVNTHLGIALARSGQDAAARTAFQAVKGGTRAQIAAMWMLWLDTKGGAAATTAATTTAG